MHSKLCRWVFSVVVRTQYLFFTGTLHLLSSPPTTTTTTTSQFSPLTTPPTPPCTGFTQHFLLDSRCRYHCHHLSPKEMILWSFCCLKHLIGFNVFRKHQWQHCQYQGVRGAVLQKVASLQVSEAPHAAHSADWFSALLWAMRQRAALLTTSRLQGQGREWLYWVGVSSIETERHSWPQVDSRDREQNGHMGWGSPVALVV